MWKLALCQTDVVFKYPDANYARIEKAIVEAAKNGADIAVLPEMWNTGYALNELAGVADLNGERTKEFLATLSEKHQIAIIGGSVSISEGTKFSNTMYAFDKYGGLLSSYKKVHLFQLMNEHLYLEAGNDKNLFRLDGVSCAGFICYDIRFPEWIRKHTSEGSEVIFVLRSGLLKELLNGNNCLLRALLKIKPSSLPSIVLAMILIITSMDTRL